MALPVGLLLDAFSGRLYGVPVQQLGRSWQLSIVATGPDGVQKQVVTAEASALVLEVEDPKFAPGLNATEKARLIGSVRCCQPNLLRRRTTERARF